MISHPTRQRIVGSALALVLLVGAAACSSDDGATVRNLGDAGATGDDGTESGSATAPSPGSVSADAVDEEGGYRYASDVTAHRLITLDVCQIKEALAADSIGWAEAEALYRDGENSVNGDGSVRTLAGFATSEDGPADLDERIRSALAGSGIFADAGQEARVQTIEKGIQNQLLVAWVVDELNGALGEAEAGAIDPADGAPHVWDEAWAFYHGAAPGCAPWGTADGRAADFGTTGSDGVTALANEAIVVAMNQGRDALIAGDVDTARAAADEIVRNLVITYSQAAIRYATLVPDDVEAGDLSAAAEHRAEGLAFFRTIEGLVAERGADVGAIEAVYDLQAELGTTGGGDDVAEALTPAWDALGITADDIGTLSS